jgi:GGDEF domain-containing protein
MIWLLDMGRRICFVTAEDSSRKRAGTRRTTPLYPFRHNRFNSHQIAITISIGAAESDGDEDLNRILQRADEALYQPKNEGRNRAIQARAQETNRY